MNIGQDGSPPKAWRTTPVRLFAFAALCAVASIPCMRSWDEAWLQARESWNVPGDLRKAIELSEAYAHGSGVIVILGSLWWIDVTNRRRIGHAAITTLFAGSVANGLKFIFTRIRPHSDTNLQVDDNWLPLFHGSFWDSTHRSFPSGHAATAVALAIGLSWAYPRGRYIFYGLAGMACFQRLSSGAHFPSDVLVGAAIACCCAAPMSRIRPSELQDSR